MPRAAIEISEMLRVPGIRLQVLEAVEELSKVQNRNTTHALGQAYKICDTWQRRFESALNSDIPGWTGLAAFRCMTDYNLPDAVIKELLQSASPSGDEVRIESLTRELTTLQECRLAYVQYLEKQSDLYSGKFLLQSQAVQSWFLKRLRACTPMLGGQAGNIVFLWHCIGSDAILYTPYLSKDLAGLNVQRPSLSNLRVLQMENGQGKLNRLKDVRAIAGVPSSTGSRMPAPSAGSMTAAKNGRRILFMLPGLRVLDPISKQMDWRQVQFSYRGTALLDKAMIRTSNDLNWPSIPLFCECRINARLKQLEITLTDEEQIAATFKGKVNFAVLGGMDAIYYDDWLQRDPQLQARLLTILEKQLGTLAACGVRIGLELSGIPTREYLLFIRRMCDQGIIGTLGINGADELPHVTGEASLKNQLSDLWLDPRQVPKQVWAPANKTKVQDKHWEFLTYLRAKKLAIATNVRTLYVHTLTLDFILRRDVDPGAIAHAQAGDIMGKGFVIAALLQRAYGEDWRNQLKRMPPAVNPKAMAALGQFAQDFEAFEERGAAERLLTSGYWLAPSSKEYSLTVVPVMWPPVSENRAANVLPEKLNPTGAGDMTFGAFFLLGGV